MMKMMYPCSPAPWNNINVINGRGAFRGEMRMGSSDGSFGRARVSNAPPSLGSLSDVS